MSAHPFLRNIFTDISSAIPNSQHYDKCGDMEMRMMECMEAYGADRGAQKCADLYQDFKECVGQRKQHMRFLVSPRIMPTVDLLVLTFRPYFQAMRAERHRQWLAGERSSAEHYAKPPRVDSYWTQVIVLMGVYLAIW